MAEQTIGVCDASVVDQFNFIVSIDKDTLDFFASVIRSVLSWPVVSLVTVVIFRKPLAQLIRRIKKLKIFGNEIDVPEELLQADQSASDAGAKTTSELVGPPLANLEAVDGAEAAPSRKSGSAKGGDTADAPEGGENGLTSSDAHPNAERRTETLWNWRAFNQWTHELEGLLDDEALVPKIHMLEAWNRLNLAIEKLWAKVSSPGARAGNVTRVVSLIKLDLVDQSFFDAYMRLHRIREQVTKNGIDFSATEAQAFRKTAWRLQSLIEAIDDKTSPAPGPDRV